MEFEFSLFKKKNPQVLNFMKIRPVGTDLFHEERQTHMAKVTVAFRNVAKQP